MNRPKRPHELLIWEHLDRTERKIANGDLELFENNLP